MNVTTILAIYASILATINAIITILKFQKEGELITSTITFGSFTPDLKIKGPECLFINLHNKGNNTTTITGCSLSNFNNEKKSLTENLNNLPKDIASNDSFMVAIDAKLIRQNKPKKIEFYTSSGKVIKIRKRKLKKALSKLINKS
jgi:hypothetical protein